MPQTYHGTVIPAGGDLAYGPKAFSDSVDKGNFVCMFATLAERDAWASPPEGVLSYVTASKVLYQRLATMWSPVAGTLPTFADVAARDAQWPSPPDGAVCITLDTNTMWQRSAGAWGGVRFASVNSTGNVVVGGALDVAGTTTLAALNVTGVTNQTGALNVGTHVAFTTPAGVLYLPYGHAISSPTPTTMRLGAVGGTAYLDVETERVRVTSQPANNDWSQRGLLIQKFAGAGEPGIGFFNHANGTGGSVMVYTPPAGATEFYFTNLNNSGLLGLRCGNVNGKPVAAVANRIRAVAPGAVDADGSVDMLEVLGVLVDRIKALEDAA